MHCACLQVLLREGLMREERVTASSCIFDMDNRGGLGGNGYDAQKNGSQFFKTGADRDELTKALSIELCPIEPLRSLEYEKMERIVARSNNLLAPVSRREENNTLACGHFAQFTKAVEHGCPTPFKNLQDRHGKLSQAHLSSLDAEFADILAKGWMHKKIKFGVRAACPWIPNLAQRACNASNRVVTHGTEAEAIVSLLGAVHDVSIDGADPTMMDEAFTAAAKSIGSSSVCEDYMDSITLIAKNYVGGPLAPNIMKIDSFAKSLGASACWGEQFTNAIATTQNQYKHAPSIKLRIAAIVTQLTSEKVKDGVYQLLGANSVKALLAHTDASELEQALVHADAVAEKLEVLGVPASKANDAECIFMVRLVHYALQMTSRACNVDNFKTLDAVKGAFAADVAKLIAEHVTHTPGTKKVKSPCDWAAEVGDASQHAQGSEGSVLLAESIIEDASSPAYILGTHKITVGAYVREKGSPITYKVAAIGADGALTIETTDLFNPLQKFSVTLEQAMKAWKGLDAEKVKLQTQVGASAFGAVGAEARGAGDAALMDCWRILYNNAPDTIDLSTLSFYKSPDEMRTARAISKGDLQLLPYTDFTKVKAEAKVKGMPSGVYAKCVMDGATYFVLSPTFDTAKWEGTLSPFFWVQETTKEEEANMVWGTFEDPLEELDFKLTCLKNKRALKKDEILKVHKATIPVEPPSTKTVVEPPAKRQRKADAKGKGKGKADGKESAAKVAAAKTVKAAVKAAAKKG